MILYVDADACPVKDEVIRVGERHQSEILLVCDGGLMRPRSPWAKLVIVEGKLDAADDWIAERIGPGDICVTSGARAIDPRGKAFTPDTIGSAVATRNLMTDLRETGVITSGAKPFSQKDKSAFLNGLEALIQKVKRGL